MLTRDAAKRIYPTQHLERWSFDVELLMLSSQNNVPVVQLPVIWHEIEGSHLNVLEASIHMARDFLLIRLLYDCGFWRITDISI